MRLATWNVNSIRARVDRVTDFLERADVDVLAMQETKCSDDQFPTMPFAALGYDVVHCGFNQWNGVAIASRIGVDDVQVGFEGSRRGATVRRGGGGGAGARRDMRRCAGMESVHPERPHRRLATLRLQVGMACRAEGYGTGVACREPGRADRADRRLEHRPHR